MLNLRKCNFAGLDLPDGFVSSSGMMRFNRDDIGHAGFGKKEMNVSDVSVIVSNDRQRRKQQSVLLPLLRLLCGRR